MKLLVSIMALCAVAQAQPAPPAGPTPAPKKAPAPKAPKTPKVAPLDPYADPTPDPKAKADGKTEANAAPKTDPKAPKAAPVDPYAAAPSAAPGIPSRVGLSALTAVQGLLAVQRLDGWLLYDRDGSNPLAVRLVAPDGHPQRAWFYMIPARGEPVALVPVSEQRLFDKLPGKKLTYLGYRDLGKQVAALLKGVKSIALEYSPKAAVPNISRVDAGTVALLRAAGVPVRSSDTLVQYTKAIWGDAGRTAHYVAVHHLVELRKDALAFITPRLVAHPPVTEYEVRQRIMHGMMVRGLAGPPPVVAAGANTADPYYVPPAAKPAQHSIGDVVELGLAAKVDKPDGVYAAQTWVAVADKTVPEKLANAFQTAAAARDQALVMITDRGRKHRPVTGAEVD